LASTEVLQPPLGGGAPTAAARSSEPAQPIWAHAGLQIQASVEGKRVLSCHVDWWKLWWCRCSARRWNGRSHHPVLTQIRWRSQGSSRTKTKVCLMPTNSTRHLMPRECRIGCDLVMHTHVFFTFGLGESVAKLYCLLPS
jgi:hypothetical protein